MKLIAVAILVIWVGLAILGFLVKGLMWLAILAMVLFIATAVWAWMRGRTPDRTS
jgi:putative Ca2+/H+ antiporter (TMEM165/GDT1 family)